MIEFYAQIKWVHIIAVLCSGSLFLLRGLLVQAGKPGIAMAAPVRYLTYGIDTTLLTAALMLLTILPGALFSNGWLTLKLVLLVVYVIVATYALRRGRTQRIRTICLLAALAIYVAMLGIARMHHPLGWWLLLR